MTGNKTSFKKFFCDVFFPETISPKNDCSVQKEKKIIFFINLKIYTMKTKFCFLTLLLFTILLSCNQELDYLKEDFQASTKNRSSIRSVGRSQSVMDISQTRTRGKFNNPFYIGTIKAAYLKLKSLGQISATYNITPNALYVRYLPKDESDFYQLEKTSQTELFEYPLQENDIHNNEDVTFEGENLAQDQLPFQYTVCTIGQVMTNFEVDILDTLFLNHINPIIPYEDWVKIESEAFVSTGILDPNSLNNVQSIPFCDEWFPSGKIEIWDDALNDNIPLEGAKVRVSNWFKWATTYTKENGDFSTSPQYFCKKVKYSIVFETQLWDIRDGKLKQASLSGPERRGSWNHIIKEDKKSLGFGTVHRALIRYFTKDVDGLRRPIVYGQKLKVSYRHEAGSALGWFSSSGFEGIFYSHVHIFGFNGSILRKTHSIFSTTVHELAHVAHAFQMGNIQFWQVSDLIKESWARACQWKITELEYGNSPFPVPGPIQNWYYDQDPILNNYSPLFIDLEDALNQNPSNISNRPRDVTSGYDLSLIQFKVLGHIYGLSSLRDKLKSHKPSDVTDTQIDTNLQHYFDNF
jgi:hypothetical protein